jgi:hypothetical protein
MEFTFQYAEWQNRGVTLRASLYIAGDGNTPWIVMCHGFTSHRIGPNYLFVSLARAVASAGISVNAFDFGGCGESDGDFADMTIDALQDDCISACRYVQTAFKPTRLLLLGHSFGGAIAILSSRRVMPDGLILIAPLADTKKHTQSHAHILERGFTPDDRYEYGPFELKARFLEQMRAIDPVGALRKTCVPAMILFQGDGDQQVTTDESAMYFLKAQSESIPCDFKAVTGGDHRFSTVGSRKFLQQEIVRWIKESLS